MTDNDTKRLSRLISILTQFQTKRLLTSTTLAEKFGVSVRTIYRDIKALEQAGVPILTEEGKGYYLMEGYRIPPVMFTESEANALITAEQLILKNKDASFVKEYKEAVNKIKSVLKSVGKRTSFLMGLEIRNGNKISIGSNCVINKKVLLDGRGGLIKIGDNVDIAQETNIWTLEHNVHDDQHQSIGGDVIIEDFVWIASRVTILPGVQIGKGAVVASNSVVTKNITPMDIVGGIPAKKIGVRKNLLKYNLYHRPWFE